jgi:hypothetical protein
MSKLIAVLGFDVGYIIRIASRMYDRDRVRAAYLLISSIRGSVDQRSRAAAADTAKILEILGSRAEVFTIEITDPMEAVIKVVEVMEQASRDLGEREELIISLSGGTRALVLYTVIAALHLIAKGEVINEIASLIYGEEAGGAEAIVLRVLRELKKVKLSEIQGELEKRGFRWTKQYTQKILKKLEEKGLARKISRGRYIAS